MNENRKEFQGSLAVVTGGSRGIGRAICYEFASKGANIAFIYLEGHPKARETYNKLKSFNMNTEQICADVSNHIAVQDLFSKILNSYGRIDILVNNAGINIDKTITKLSIDDWNRVIHTNLSGCFNCCQAALKSMKTHNYGRIINISSIIAQTGNIGQTNYAASKAGIIGFTKSLALETAKYDITVNAICPGFVETDMLKTIPFEIKQKILEKIPKGRFASPEEIARVVSFLASPQSGYITGQVINIRLVAK